jgi:protein-S-isoprenylcysteine O-methyltransferase Ste14
MADPVVIRSAGLLIPLCLTLGLVSLKRPDRRVGTAVFLAWLWVFVGILPVNLLAFQFGWWRFDAHGGLFLGIPVDLWLGWALAWGALPVLSFPRVPIWILVVAGGLTDIILMPAADPVVILGSDWLRGEAIGIVACLVPAQLLGRWTLENRRLAARALAQLVLFASLSLWLLPSIILERTGGCWCFATSVAPWMLGLTGQVVMVPAALGAAALLEFAQRGRGTPFPGDPPERLVTTGPYAYVANPMQLSMTAIMACVGALVGSLPVALAGLLAAGFGYGFARWAEEGELEGRFGEAWVSYRRSVRDWLPRWRPIDGASATLYFAESCLACSQVGRWFAERGPIGLQLRAAETYPGRPLTRLTYLAADGSAFAGVAAVARALDHLNLGWAWLGWMLRLPGACQSMQLVVDALGGEPRVIPSRTS